MSDLGRQLRRSLDEVAPPADLDWIVSHEPSLPFWRVGRVLAYATALVAIVAVTIVLLTADDMDGTATESSVTTVQGTETTLGEGTATTRPGNAGIAFDTRPLTGRWYGTNPTPEGLMVLTNDMIWDGESFYVLTRLGFGDHVVWRSSNGIDWERYRTIAAAGELGITGVYSGPTELVSVDGRLIAAGNANGRATVWIDDGSQPWRSVDVAPGGVRSLLVIDDRLVALLDLVLPPERPSEVDLDAPSVWVSSDGEVWEEVAGEDTFGEIVRASDMVAGPAGLLFLGVEGDRDDAAQGGDVAVLMSPDGVVWSRVEPIGAQLHFSSPLVAGDFGYAVHGFAGSVVVSRDGESWVALTGGLAISQQEGIALGQNLGVVGDHLVLVGAESFTPSGSDFNTAHPRVWSYVGDAGWERVGGDFEWFDRPGFLYETVTGGDTMVVLADTQDDGPEEWGLMTFVADPGAAATESGCGADVDVVPWVGLPSSVEATRVRLIELAAKCDIDGLTEMAAAGSEPFEYPLAHRFPTPDLLWSALQGRGARPMGVLAGVLSGPHTSWEAPGGTVYAWPPPSETSNVEYEPLATISGSGEWLSYVIPARLLPDGFPRETLIEGTRAPYTFDETQSYGEFGPLLWHLITTVNGADDIPHGPGYEWVEWGPNWAGHQPDDGPHDVYGVTDLSTVDLNAVASGIPIGTAIVLREVRWSLDELEEFKAALNAGAPENGICSTGSGVEPNRIRITATRSSPDLGEVPPDAVWLDEVYDGKCPSLLFGEELVEPLHLYVSNQSFEIDPVHIVVTLDGAVIVDDHFYVVNQHVWIPFDLDVTIGLHDLRAETPGTGAVLEETIEVTEESWAVLDFWVASQGEPPYFGWSGLLDAPPAFL